MHVAENFHSWVTGDSFLNGNVFTHYTKRLVSLNARLEKDARLSRFNEALLEERLSELEEIGCMWDSAYGLSLARINELALLCAGNYADHGEVQGVGDFLFNPRRILVHIRGMPIPVVKERHMALTEQFADVASSRGGVVEWLRGQTVLEIERQPLLPHLYDRLRDSRAVSRDYLDSVNDRMTKIADLTAMVASGHFAKGLDMHQWLQYAAGPDRKFLESKLCRFDAKVFFELGKDVGQLLQLKNLQPGFLGRMDRAPAIH